MPEGVALDIVTRIVNVQWEGGLAVIFGPEAEDAPEQEEETA